MKIEWFGHACFKISDSLVIDPYKDGSVPGYFPLRLEADKVICSHEHADHSGRENVTLSGNNCALETETVASWHDDQQGALRGPNNITIVKADGEKLVHLGDLGHFPDEAQLSAIKDADYLLIPVGGYYTIDGAMAAKICEATNPKHIVPMHYRDDAHGYDVLSTLDVFLDAIKNTPLAERVLTLPIQA